jgi:2'-5' RNA ligase
MTPNWFVAWPLVGCRDWLASLEAEAPGGLQFLDPDDVHVTLAFLGRHDHALVPKIAGLLNGLPLNGVEITPGEFVALPQPRRFSALAFTVGAGRQELEKQIAKWRDRICREAGARLETRAPLPHFTVARPERRIGAADRDAALAWIEQLPPQTTVRLQLDRPRIYAWSEPGATRRYRQLD